MSTDFKFFVSFVTGDMFCCSGYKYSEDGSEIILSNARHVTSVGWYNKELTFRNHIHNIRIIVPGDFTFGDVDEFPVLDQLDEN